MRLNILSFATTLALIWGFGVFGLTWWVIAFEGVTHDPTLIGHLYRGYNISPIGSLIGLAWALPDGFIGGLLFAWIYNGLAARFEERRSARDQKQGATSPSANLRTSAH